MAAEFVTNVDVFIRAESEDEADRITRQLLNDLVLVDAVVEVRAEYPPESV